MKGNMEFGVSRAFANFPLVFVAIRANERVHDTVDDSTFPRRRLLPIPVEIPRRKWIRSYLDNRLC